MKIRRKGTNEIIEIGEVTSSPVQAVETPTANPNMIDTIRSRGTIQSDVQDIGRQFQEPGVMNKVVASARGLGTLFAPFQAVESAISNPIIKAQQGLNLSSPLEAAKSYGGLMKSAVKGLTLQERGEYGDVLKQAGAPTPIAATGGFLLSLATPMKVFSQVNKELSGLGKITDRGLKKAGNRLVEASEAATTNVGKTLDDAFAQVASNPVDATKFTAILNELPEVLKNEVVKKIDGQDLMNPTVATLRKLKQLVGKHNPGSFGREERGLLENITSDNINDAYRGLKVLLQDSVSSLGKDVAKSLMAAEEGFSRVARASQFVHKGVMDPVLRQATRAGEFAKRMTNPLIQSERVALSTLRKASKESKRGVEEAVEALKKFNRYRAGVDLGKKAAGAAIFGGAVGAIGGKAARGTFGDKE